jgi:hypothetical protein
MWLVKLNPDEQRFLSEGFPGFVGNACVENSFTVNDK